MNRNNGIFSNNPDCFLREIHAILVTLKAGINSKTEITFISILSVSVIFNIVSFVFNIYQILYHRIIFLCAMRTLYGTMGSLLDLHTCYFSAHFTGFLRAKQHGEVEDKALGPKGSRQAISSLLCGLWSFRWVTCPLGRQGISFLIN